MTRYGIFTMGFSFIFQLINSILIIGMIYIFYYLAFKLPKQMKMNTERLQRIERLLEDIREKTDRKQ